MSITVEQAIRYAWAAGFRGVRLIYVVAIAMAETGGQLNTNAQSPNPDGGTNYGILQIDQKAHPQWTAQQLQDPAGAFVAAFTISKGGTDFSPWQTWNPQGNTPGKAWSYVGTVWKAAVSMGGVYADAAHQLAGKAGDLPAIAGDSTGNAQANPGLPNVTDPAAYGVPDVAGAISAAIPRLGWILVGALLLIAGVFILVNPAGDIGPAIQAASQSKEPIPDA